MVLAIDKLTSSLAAVVYGSAVKGHVSTGSNVAEQGKHGSRFITCAVLTTISYVFRSWDPSVARDSSRTRGCRSFEDMRSLGSMGDNSQGGRYDNRSIVFQLDHVTMSASQSVYVTGDSGTPPIESRVN